MSGGGRGKGLGTGSPISFKCYRDRLGYGRVGGHIVRRTGAERTYRPKMYSALGARSTAVAREYRCTCGHVGWSAHIDLARYPGEIEG